MFSKCRLAFLLAFLGVFVCAESFAQSRFIQKDRDGDGLWDDWEKAKEISGSPRVDLNQPSETHPDIYIEIDWLRGVSPSVVNGLFKTELPRIKTLFWKRAKVNLHFEKGSEYASNVPIITRSQWGTIRDGPDETQEGIFSSRRRLAYRHCLLANLLKGRDKPDGTPEFRLGTSAPFPSGQSFLVATRKSKDLGNGDYEPGADHKITTITSTLVHELGHTLGLSHGGIISAEREDTITWKRAPARLEEWLVSEGDRVQFQQPIAFVRLANGRRYTLKAVWKSKFFSTVDSDDPGLLLKEGTNYFIKRKMGPQSVPKGEMIPRGKNVCSITYNEVHRDHDLRKPNHFSVMNYAWSKSGIRKVTNPSPSDQGIDHEIDYQNFELDRSLNEASLNENHGLKGGQSPTSDQLKLFTFVCTENTQPRGPKYKYRYIPFTRKINWNGQGGATDVGLQINLNADKYVFTLSRSSNEWKNLKFKVGKIGSFSHFRKPSKRR